MSPDEEDRLVQQLLSQYNDDVRADCARSRFALNADCAKRYLRARQWSCTKAKTMLDATIAWRREFGLEGLHEKKWDAVLAKENATGKMYVRGFSQCGRPLLYMKPRFENTHEYDGNLKHLVYNMERAASIMDNEDSGAPSGNEEKKILLLIDYKDYSLFNAPPMKTSMDTLSILQNHYPERLFRAYCINPPFIMHGFWAMISPFIDPVTKDKIHMVHDTKELLRAVDKSQLEQGLGGELAETFSSEAYLRSALSLDYNAACEACKSSDA